jgi:hypothetical protein
MDIDVIKRSLVCYGLMIVGYILCYLQYNVLNGYPLLVLFINAIVIFVATSVFIRIDL